MTNVFVGFHDQRSCSRILKPPGGGTSDIFGTNIRKTEIPAKIEETPAKVVEEAPETPSDEVIEKPVEPVEVTPPQKEEPAPDHHDSKNGMNGDSETAKPEDLKVEELSIKEDKITAEIVNRKEECKIETHSEESRTKVSKQKIDTIGSILQQDDIEVAGVQKKTVKSPNRVPPGGYSSGLW
ncbi:unnamed protein product [Callosobruchus maculatus]|uniref:Microtubule-associated protein Jupiter n=1 Tax=Callosobruchus maculatus TaxID=64391 RepID=A0A653CCN1_CALMS|nr:unnamed protein product [Callosobruchus maculatus]